MKTRTLAVIAAAAALDYWVQLWWRDKYVPGKTLYALAYTGLSKVTEPLLGMDALGKKPVRRVDGPTEGVPGYRFRPSSPP